MEARIKFAVTVIAFFSLGADYATKNFVVSAPDPQLAKQVAIAAEQFRHDLAIQWLGHELPGWTEKCPVTVKLASQAGGQTSFGFVNEGSNSVPVGWQMEVYGSPERILDSVLPHEVTHTIFATHFGRPLPRWADEGACTTVEHVSERNKNHELLLRFLTTNRGIPFNRMFAMKQYPHDIYPLYAQGYSLARFLIMQGGRQHFVEYVGTGMTTEQPGIEPRAWDAATKKFYGYDDLSELQVRWIQWVKQGCPDLPPAQATQVAGIVAHPTPQLQIADKSGGTTTVPKAIAAAPGSWYVSQTPSVTTATPSPVQLQNGPGANLDSGNNYRPGSIRESRPVEILATISATNVSANRLNPGSNYTARPEIQPAGVMARSIWR